MQIKRYKTRPTDPIKLSMCVCKNPTPRARPPWSITIRTMKCQCQGISFHPNQASNIGNREERELSCLFFRWTFRFSFAVVFFV